MFIASVSVRPFRTCPLSTHYFPITVLSVASVSGELSPIEDQVAVPISDGALGGILPSVIDAHLAQDDGPPLRVEPSLSRGGGNGGGMIGVGGTAGGTSHDSGAACQIYASGALTSESAARGRGMGGGGNLTQRRAEAERVMLMYAYS